MTPLTSRRRDRARAAILGATALVTTGSLTAVGWLAGTAAHAHQRDQARSDAAQARAAAARARYDAALAQRRADLRGPRVVLRQRPHRTVVSTRYAAAPTVTLGGGTLSAPSRPAPAPSGHTPHPPAAPPPPPAPPPPAPTSGS